ncbi:hypothetical protein ACE6H2_023073 [Prunus campanulata]
MEMTVRSLRVTERQRQSKKDYRQAMSLELEDLEQIRIDTYNLSRSRHGHSTNTSSKRLSPKATWCGWPFFPLEPKTQDSVNSQRLGKAHS